MTKQLAPGGAPRHSVFVRFCLCVCPEYIWCCALVFSLSDWLARYNTHEHTRRLVFQCWDSSAALVLVLILFDANKHSWFEPRATRGETPSDADTRRYLETELPASESPMQGA